MEQARLRIDGMTCGGCAAAVERALRQVEGVSDVSVLLESGEAHVAFDEARSSRGALLDAVREAGYAVAEGRDPKPTHARRGHACCGRSAR